MIVTQCFNGLITRLGETPVNFGIPVQLTYDPDQPFAVDMLLVQEHDDNVEWRFAVDLLAEGLQTRHGGRVGAGDIRMGLTRSRDLGVCLSSPEGHCHLMLPRFEVTSFLAKVGQAGTDLAVVDQAIDRFIEETLGA